MRLIYSIGIMAIVLFLAVLHAAPAYAETLVFGVYTSDKPTTMFNKFNPILSHVAKQMAQNGFPVDFRIKIYPSYLKGIEALVNGECDFSRFGPASYIIAKEKEKKIRLLVMEHKKKKKNFKGIFIAARNSAIRSIHDLKGKSFAFGNKYSTIGRYLSQAELIKVGIKASDLSRYKYLGRHDKVALAVANGLYDAGVVKENTFNKYAKPRGLKNIGQFLNVTKPWVVRAGLNDGTFGALQSIFLDLVDKDVLKFLKQHGFLKAVDADYNFVREGMKLSEAFDQ